MMEESGRVQELEAELARRERNETRNCLNWGPCSRHDGPMGLANEAGPFEARCDPERPWIWRIWDVQHPALCNQFPVLTVDSNGASEDFHAAYARICTAALNAAFRPGAAQCGRSGEAIDPATQIAGSTEGEHAVGA